MMQGLGTSWMIRQPGDMFDRLIGQMSLTEVRPYMCPKSHGNPKKCENCDGFKTCPAGQRAVRLTHEGENSPAEAAPVKQIQGDPVKEREEFRAACESGNAWFYLMQTKGLSKDAAGELLSRLAKKFPGVAADFGGSRRIMQRPKVVKVLESVRAEDSQEQAPEAVDEETLTVAEEVPESAENGRRTDAAIAARIVSVREVQRSRCMEAVQSGNVREFLLAQGRTRHNVTNTISRWRKLFPDLMDDVPKVRSGRKKTEEPEDLQQEEKDEISLEDFLAEYEPQETADPMLAEMRSRRTALTAEKDRLCEEIEKAEERIRCIEEQLEALTLCIDRFGT